MCIFEHHSPNQLYKKTAVFCLLHTKTCSTCSVQINVWLNLISTFLHACTTTTVLEVDAGIHLLRDLGLLRKPARSGEGLVLEGIFFQ